MGALVARSLGAAFSDVDELIERDEHRTVSKLFAERGETAFRLLERAQVERLMEAAPGVIAPGGGWAAQAGALEQVQGLVLTVYLDTAPETAGQRTASQGHRPLLVGGDPYETMRALFAARRAFYERADGVVKTDERTPEAVAMEVVALARSAGGW